MTSTITAIKPREGFDLFQQYFSYVGVTESPTIFHRWTLISVVGALLARNIYFPFGHSEIYPNQYILLTGSPAARKGTAINIGKRLLYQLAYQHIAPNKAAKEAFWDWLANHQQDKEQESTLDFLFEITENTSTLSEAYIIHDEFLDFMGIGETDLMLNLTNLWDNLPKFVNPKTRGAWINIPNPTINILSGITPTGINNSFKEIAVGGGFFSRVLFVYGTQSVDKITFPSSPDPKLVTEILEHLAKVQQLTGIIHLTNDVRNIIDKIYKSTPRMLDPRFQYYTERRLTHLIKLIIILSAMRLSLTPIVQDVILANTILYNTELQMPKALGEYGKSRNAEISNTIITALRDAKTPLTLKDISKLVGRDLNKYSELIELLHLLQQQERIQIVKTSGKHPVYIPNNEINMTWDESLINFDLLEDKEHMQ